MLPISDTLRRSILFVVALASVSVGWQAAVLAGDHICAHTTYGAQSANDEIIVLFEVEVQTPTPHWESAGIPQAQLDYVTSDLIVPPSYWANLYAKSVSGFDSGKHYKVTYYLKVGNDLIYQDDDDWTQE